MLPREHYLKQAFQDLAHFPNGFEKGGLSDIQARLVRKNGTLISALCIDEVSDPTPEDLHILKVIANQSSPKNPVEQAWVKYLSIVKNLAAANPKGKSKSKAAKAEPVVEAAKPAEKVQKPAPAPEKAPIIEKKAEKASTNKITTTKKAEPAAPVEVKPKGKPAAAKAEPKAPVKAPAKAVAEPKKAETKKVETKKAEVKKVEVKKAAPKKAEPKKPEPKAKVAAAKKAEEKKSAAKKTTKTK
jgi:uncharacterized protein YifE (UPF0438 family)